jgi:hypothetical protein
MTPACITPEQRSVHVVTEAVAVFAVTPFMFWLGTKKELPTWARGTSLAIAAGTLLIDGWLLVRWLGTKG